MVFFNFCIEIYGFFYIDKTYDDIAFFIGNILWPEVLLIVDMIWLEVYVYNFIFIFIYDYGNIFYKYS